MILGVSSDSKTQEYHPLDIRHKNTNIIVYYSQFTEFFILGLAFTCGFSVATGAKTSKEVQMFVSAFIKIFINITLYEMNMSSTI